jgi:hypothetical protein
MVKTKWWEWFIIACGLFSVVLFLVLVWTALYREWNDVSETVTWYQTQVKPQIEAQRAREQQVLAQAAAQAAEKHPREAQITPVPTPMPTPKEK